MPNVVSIRSVIQAFLRHKEGCWEGRGPIGRGMAGVLTVLVMEMRGSQQEKSWRVGKQGDRCVGEGMSWVSYL